MIRIIYTSHARERISERKILVTYIKQALIDPTARLTSYPPTQRIQKIIKEKTLEIVFEQKGQNIIIITAYYL